MVPRGTGEALDFRVVSFRDGLELLQGLCHAFFGYSAHDILLVVCLDNRCVKTPKDPSATTRPAGRYDYNQSARAGFAAVEGQATIVSSSTHAVISATTKPRQPNKV